MRRRKKKKSNILIVVLISIFMVSSIGSVIVFYGGNDNSDSLSLTYSGVKYRFNRVVNQAGNQYYEVSSKNSEFISYYLPDRLFLDIDNQTKELIKNTNYFYLSFDPNQEDLSYSDFLRFDIRNNIPTSKFFVDSITEESTQYNLPIITCKNATFNTPVIILKNTNTTNITLNENCINLDFARNNVLQIRDLFVYLLNGIDVR